MAETKTLWPAESKGFCDLHENIMLWYGRPKIGKSTLGSQFPGALFFSTEKGTKHLKVHEWRINTWTEFCARIADLERNIKDCPFQNIIIDTADNLFDMCLEFTCAKLGIDDLIDAGYGKGHAAYEREFKKQINRLTKLGLGVFFISHDESKTVGWDTVTNPYAPMKADEKGMLEMIVPTLDKRARRFVLGLVDMILYLDIDAHQKRVIYTKPTVAFEAGDRTGRLPESLPLSFEALVEAYYGNGNGSARAQVIERLNTAEQYLAQHQIDGFDSPTRVENSRKKHIGSADFLAENVTLTQLEELLQHYRMKAKNALNGNGEKK